MKKLLSIFTACIMLLTVVPISAIAKTSGKTIASIQTYPEVRDVAQLLGIASTNLNPTTSSTLIKNDKQFKVSINEETVIIQQLLSDITYTDNSTEKEYVQNTIIAIDEDYNTLSPHTFIGNHEMTGHGTLCTAVSKIHYTYLTDGFTGRFSLSRGTTNITYNNTGDSLDIDMEVGVWDSVLSMYDNSDKQSYSGVRANKEYIVYSSTNAFTNLAPGIRTFKLYSYVKKGSAPIITIVNEFDGGSLSLGGR